MEQQSQAQNSSPTPVDLGSLAVEPQAAPKHNQNAGEFCWGVGRRKKATARVRIRPGSGKLLVNKKELDTFFSNPRDRKDVLLVLEVSNSADRFDVFARVEGGGPTGQAGALVLGLARAIAKADPETTHILKDAGMMTRDSRMKERKKYGQRGARRSFQFSKR